MTLTHYLISNTKHLVTTMKLSVRKCKSGQPTDHDSLCVLKKLLIKARLLNI